MTPKPSRATANVANACLQFWFVGRTPEVREPLVPQDGSAHVTAFFVELAEAKVDVRQFAAPPIAWPFSIERPPNVRSLSIPRQPRGKTRVAAATLVLAYQNRK